jgi:hypothetical protein
MAPAKRKAPHHAKRPPPLADSDSEVESDELQDIIEHAEAGVDFDQFEALQDEDDGEDDDDDDDDEGDDEEDEEQEEQHIYNAEAMEQRAQELAFMGGAAPWIETLLVEYPVSLSGELDAQPNDDFKREMALYVPPAACTATACSM